MLEKIDTWIGKTLFVPPIVRFCQWSGWSQYLVHNFLYLIGSYMMLMAVMAKGESAVLEFFVALVLTVKIGRDPEYKGYESRFLRYSFIVISVIHVIAHVTGRHILGSGPNWDLSCPVVTMWLTAEYARTIKTIPPLEDKARERKVVRVTAR
jgi:hypothetical protein